MRIGEMRWRLKVQQPVEAQDDEYGGTGPGGKTWEDIGEAWASRTNTLRAAGEAVAAGSIVASEIVQWNMRPRPMKASWRLVGVGGTHDGVVYDVKNFGLSNDRSELAVITVTGANNG